MSKRTQSIRSMFSGQSEHSVDGDIKRPALPRMSSGAVRSLKDTFSDVEKEYEVLRAKLASGQLAVEIDPTLIDPSPLADRFSEQDPASFEALITSIRERGQEIPGPPPRASFFIRSLPERLRTSAHSRRSCARHSRQSLCALAER